MDKNFDRNDLFYVESRLPGSRTSLFDLASWKNGLAFKNIDFSSTGKPIIKIAELNNGITENTAYTNKKYDDEVALTRGDIVFSWSGNPQTSIDVFIYRLPDGWLNQHIFKVTPATNVNKNFLFYVLKYLKPNFTKIATNKQTTGLGHVTLADIKRISVILPNMALQKTIAKVLSALDTKIEQNIAINNNLEQQFKELYKSYFCGSNSDSWDNVLLPEFIFFQEGPGIRNWQYVTENGTKFINIRCINDGDIDTSTANMISNEEANGKYKHFMLEENDIVMSCSGTLGRYAIVRKEHLPLCLNTSVIRFKYIEQPEDFAYIYGYLTSSEFLNKQAEMACGSVQCNFGPTHLKKITMKKPPKQLRLDFYKIGFPILNLILQNRKESTQLALVRDTLLPKLMSGEIDVSKVDISDPSCLDKSLFNYVEG